MLSPLRNSAPVVCAILRTAYVTVVILSVAIQNTLSDPLLFAVFVPPDPKPRWIPFRSDIRTSGSYLETMPGRDVLRIFNVKSHRAGDSSSPPFVDQDLQ
jgi:hypothetical protein